MHVHVRGRASLAEEGVRGWNFRDTLSGSEVRHIQDLQEYDTVSDKYLTRSRSYRDSPVQTRPKMPVGSHGGIGIEAEASIDIVTWKMKARKGRCE